MKHTILGAGGSIGNPLAVELLAKQESVRLVSRSGFLMAGAESVKADLGSYEQTRDAVKDSDVVYLCAGLKYDSKVWAEQWPKIMKNTIDACKNENARLIFFDNVYMYGKVDGQMTEETSYNPCSRKGEIRAEIARMLEDEYQSGNLTASIARGADLYGPYADKNSIPYIMVIEKFRAGKSAQWMATIQTSHSYSYTLDSAKAMVLLAGDEKSFNQVWHMPTANPAPTGKELIDLFASEINVPAKYSVLKKWMVSAAGLFNKTIAEVGEMLYQMEYDYQFDSSKFNNYFGYQPVSYKQGVKETLAFFKNA